MDDWGFEHLSAWLERRVHLPVGRLFCVIDGATKGRRDWSGTAVRGGGGPSRRAPSASCRRRVSAIHCSVAASRGVAAVSV
jgi:hypothetical protein